LFFRGNTHANKAAYVRWLKTRDVTIEKKVSWNDAYLDKALGKKFKIIRPRMPLQDYAQYEEWKLHFERFIPKLKNDLILVGGSLGGIFLAKYLSENRFPKRILATYLVCPPYDNSLPKETLAGGFRLKSDLSLLERQAGKLTLLFSKNDDVVPVAHAGKYRKKLPRARIIVYKNKNGHFRIPRFPEIVRMIKRDAVIK
jgi:predicted alpha/beta hydrolase family esterase